MPASTLTARWTPPTPNALAERLVECGDATANITGDGSEGFGIALSALSARDVDGDEAAELMVGAGENSGGGRAAGAAYLYYGPISGSFEATDAARIPTGEASHDGAGWGLAFADLSGDGAIDLLLGAPGDEMGNDSAGAVYRLTP